MSTGPVSIGVGRGCGRRPVLHGLSLKSSAVWADANEHVDRTRKTTRTPGARRRSDARLGAPGLPAPRPDRVARRLRQRATGKQAASCQGRRLGVPGCSGVDRARRRPARAELRLRDPGGGGRRRLRDPPAASPSDRRANAAGSAFGVSALLVGRPLRRRDRFQPLVRNRLSTLDRHAVGSGCETLLGSFEGGELVA